MFRKKNIYILSLCILTVFFILTFYFIYSINIINTNYINLRDKVTTTTEYDIEMIENEIKLRAMNPSDKYKKKQTTADVILQNFLNNIVPNGQNINLKDLWQVSDSQVNKNQIFSNNTNIGNIILALNTAKILHADVYSKGTQLKLLLKLEGDHLAVFKPQWYDKEKVILGSVYAGKDRISSEILAFYLGGILDLRLVPYVAHRLIDIKQEILPVSSKLLNSTMFEYKDQICIYGKCHYCNRKDPICTNNEGKISGAIIFYIPGKLQIFNSPWQRTYKKGKRALWQTQSNYCSTVRNKISNKRLLDLIDEAIFDFLIQNGDRHHYEVLYDKVILMDNGKGLGNPYVDHLDILAPLYQCCILRRSTWERLKMLSGGVIQDVLKSIKEIQNVVSNQHLKAMEGRLQLIYESVETCKLHKEFLLY